MVTNWQRESCCEQFVIEVCEGLIGADDAVAGAVGVDFLGLEGAFEEDGEECGGHAVAHGIGDEEGDVVFIEACDVVDVTGDVGGGSEEDVEGDAIEAGELAWEEIDLEACGKAHFLIDLGDLGIEAVVELAEHGVFALRPHTRPGQGRGRTSGES